MSFNIELYDNWSDSNVVTKNIELRTTLTGTLKDNTSITNPVVLVAADLIVIGGVNYVKIPSFGRYYFVNDMISVRAGLVEMHLHVDVLMSYDTGIRANTAIIEKQENANCFNLYINDGSFKVYQNPHVITKEFPTGFSTQEFVLGVAGS